MVRLLGATSLPASAARRILISDRLHISEALHDVSWWIDLCIDYRSLGAVPRGIRISEIVTPLFLGPDDCPLVLHVDAAENGVGGFWNGSHGNPGTRWCRAPLPSGVTLAWERGGKGSPEMVGVQCLLAFAKPRHCWELFKPSWPFSLRRTPIVCYNMVSWFFQILRWWLMFGIRSTPQSLFSLI